MMRKLGVHTSIAGGLHMAIERARALGCSTAQIFSHNPRGWLTREIPAEEAARFRRLARRYSVSPVYVHASYLINIASPSEELRRKSAALLGEEIRRAEAIGADYVVLHAGNARDERGARRAASSIIDAVGRSGGRARLLLENTASPLAGLLMILAEAAEAVSGVCLDSCHAFAAGYDVRTDEGMGSLLAALAGHRIGLLHLNDSRGGLGSGLDRHEHIGKGRIGAMGLRRFAEHKALAEIPLILETPRKSEADDVENLGRVRKMLSIPVPKFKTIVS